MSFQLDISKTYDRVDWVFLETIMNRLGFGEEWMKGMMICVKSVSYKWRA